MNYTMIGTGISIALAVCILVGAGIGALRGWTKALIRILVVLFAALLTMFLTPVISKAMVDVNISALGITINGTKVTTIAALIASLLGGYGLDAATISSMPTVESLINNLPLLILNVLVYVVFFLLFLIVSLIIYVILVAIFFPKKKRVVTPKRRWLGAIIGGLQGLIVFAVLMMPMMGFVGMCKDFLATIESTETETAESVAYVEDLDNNDIVYVADTTTGGGSGTSTKININLDKVKEALNQFDQNPGMKVLNFMGFQGVSNWTYDNLTTTEIAGEKVKMRDEVLGVGKLIKSADKLGKLDETITEQDIQNLKDVINEAFESKVLSGVVTEVIPAVATKWSNSEKFIISKPNVSAEIKPLFDSLLKTLSTANKETIKADLLNAVDVLEVARKHNVFVALKNKEDVINILNTPGLVKELLATALNNSIVKGVFTDALNYGMEQVYKALGVENYTEYKSLKKSSELSPAEWTAEREVLGDMLENMVSFAITLKDNSAVTIDNIDFDKLGKIFDDMKQSIFLNTVSKNIVLAVLRSPKTNASIPTAFVSKIEEDWDNITNFGATFKVVQASLNISNKINGENVENLTAEDMQVLLENLGEAGVADIIKDLATEDNLKSMNIPEQTAGAVSEVITNITDAIEEMENVDYAKEAAAMETLMNTYKDIQNGSPVIDNTEDAQKIVDSLVDSDVILDAMTKTEGAGSITNTIQGSVNAEQKDMVEVELNNKANELKEAGEVSAEQKAKLEQVAALFGLTGWTFPE